jgi:hypothetical protein
VVLQVSLIQADNFSWFGYPDDTVPSARNLVPGLAKVRTMTCATTAETDVQSCVHCPCSRQLLRVRKQEGLS